jgi:AcrR family transcriptional regulator
MMNKNTARGRPRTFDEGEVLARAQQVFLERGFEAASYDDMAAALGLSKPSLYNAFGDKTALFERALAVYADRAHAQIVVDFTGADSLAEAGRKLLLAAADVYAKPEGPSVGCLLVGTALPACVALERPRQTLADFVAALERSLENAIATHYAKDVSKTGKTPRALALQLSSLLFSLAVRARTGLSRRKLRAVALELAELVG